MNVRALEVGTGRVVVGELQTMPVASVDSLGIDGFSIFIVDGVVVDPESIEQIEELEEGVT